jgi:uncharacterized protein YukE
MHITADPTRLEALAHDTAQRAQDLRDRAAQLAAAAAGTRWESLSSRAFQNEIARLATQLKQDAGRIDDVAGALRQHADRVRSVVATLARTAEAMARDAERTLTGWF